MSDDNPSAGMDGYIFTDNVFAFEGAASVQVEENFCKPWRVDFNRLDFYPFLKDDVAMCCSGVRLCFTTDSQQVALDLAACPEGTQLDLFANDELMEEATPVPGSQCVNFKPLPEGRKRINIWLPHGTEFQLRRLLVESGALIRRTQVTRKRWITYGSSITHARSGRTPSKIWPALVAQKLNLHLTTFGFGGNCQSEPMMGRLIRDLPADYITLKLGINSLGGALSARTFGPNVIGLVNIIREKHPTTPLALVSPIYSPPRETEKSGSGLSLQDMREIHKEIVDTCRRYGDCNIWYADGMKIFGEAELKYMPDELHPDADGQFALADNFIREVFGQFPDC